MWRERIDNIRSNTWEALCLLYCLCIHPFPLTSSIDLQYHIFYQPFFLLLLSYLNHRFSLVFLLFFRGLYSRLSLDFPSVSSLSSPVFILSLLYPLVPSPYHWLLIYSFHRLLSFLLTFTSWLPTGFPPIFWNISPLHSSPIPAASSSSCPLHISLSLNPPFCSPSLLTISILSFRLLAPFPYLSSSSCPFLLHLSLCLSAPYRGGPTLCHHKQRARLMRSLAGPGTLASWLSLHFLRFLLSCVPPTLFFIFLLYCLIFLFHVFNFDFLSYFQKFVSYVTQVYVYFVVVFLHLIIVYLLMYILYLLTIFLSTEICHQFLSHLFIQLVSNYRLIISYVSSFLQNIFFFLLVFIVILFPSNILAQTHDHFCELPKIAFHSSKYIILKCVHVLLASSLYQYSYYLFITYYSCCILSFTCFLLLIRFIAPSLVYF